METAWVRSLRHGYGAAIDQIDELLRLCPEAMWEESLFEVRREQPFVWPVRRAGEREYPDEATQEQLLQVHSAFWNVAYHAIFHLDFYLSGAVLPFKAPAPFQERDHHGNVVPARTYTRGELLAYLRHARQKAQATLAGLSDEDAARPLPPKSQRRGQPFSDLLVHNLLHLQEHAGQLSLFLGQKAGISVDGRRLMLYGGVRDRTDQEIDAFATSVGGYERLLPAVLAGFCSRIDAREACVVRFDVGGSYVVRVAPGGAVVEKRVPKAVDATVRMSAQDFLRSMVGDLELTGAAAAGRVEVEGDSAAVERLLGMVRR